MRDRRTNELRGRSFPHRPDKPIVSYVARRVEDTAGRGYPISLPLVRFAARPPAPAPFVPIDARVLEHRRLSAELLADAMRLARLIPRFEVPAFYLRSSTFEARS